MNNIEDTSKYVVKEMIRKYNNTFYVHTKPLGLHLLNNRKTIMEHMLWVRYFTRSSEVPGKVSVLKSLNYKEDPWAFLRAIKERKRVS